MGIKINDRVVAIASLTTTPQICVGAWGTVTKISEHAPLSRAYLVQFDGHPWEVECIDGDLVVAGSVAVLEADQVTRVLIDALALRHAVMVKLATEAKGKGENTIATTVAAEIRLLITMVAGWKIEAPAPKRQSPTAALAIHPLGAMARKVALARVIEKVIPASPNLGHSPDVDILTGEMIAGEPRR